MNRINPLVCFFLFLLSSVTGRGLTIESGPQVGKFKGPDTIESEFKVIKVEKVEVGCSSDENGNLFYHGEDIRVTTGACAVRLTDVKSKKAYAVYGGSDACSYKIGTKIKLTIKQDWCGGVYNAKCNLSSKTVISPPPPYSSHLWFCTSAFEYLIKGAVESEK